MLRPIRLPALLLALALVATVAPAWAHEDAAQESDASAAAAISAAPAGAAASPAPPPLPATGLPWLPLAAALTGAAIVWRPRRALAVALLLLLCLFAFEYGLHSVHHGARDGRLSNCSIEVASAHVAGCAVESVHVDVFLHAVARAPEAARPAVATAPLPARHGRAPPLSAS